DVARSTRQLIDEREVGPADRVEDIGRRLYDQLPTIAHDDRQCLPGNSIRQVHITIAVGRGTCVLLLSVPFHLPLAIVVARAGLRNRNGTSTGRPVCGPGQTACTSLLSGAAGNRASSQRARSRKGPRRQKEV